MEDDRTRQITELLRELPREQARPGFTARVLDRLDAPPRTTTPRWSFRLPLATAAAVLAAVAISAGVLTDWQARGRESRKAQAQQALQEIRAEHGRLEQELQEMTESPVVYLGGDENVDLVLDLGKVRNAEAVAPAAYKERNDTF
jgi:anti-sigma factor RsiW